MKKNSPPDSNANASAGSYNSERPDATAAQPASPVVDGSSTGRRRRLQRRSVSANAVSDVFYPFNRGAFHAASSTAGHEGIAIEHTYFVDEEDDEDELYHHDHYQLSPGTVAMGQQENVSSDGGDANTNITQSPLRRNGPSPPATSRQSAGMANRLTDTLGLIHPTSPGTRRRLLPRGAPNDRGSAVGSTYPPIVSPFRMMPTASNTVLSRRIKNLFGLAVVLVVCTVAPLELRSVWRDRQRAIVLEQGVDTIIMDGRIETDPPLKPVAKSENDEETPSEELSQRWHPNPTIDPNPGPFAARAYANLHPPTRPDSILGRISRHLLNLRLRISSRRNERLVYLEQQAAAAGIYDDDDFAAGMDDTDEEGGRNATDVTTREKRRERRQKRKERKERVRSARQKVVTPYTILDSEQLYRRMVALAEQYPELVRLENAQEQFGLRAVGGPSDCTFEPPALGEGCHNWYMVIEDGLYNGKGGLADDATFAAEAAAAKVDESQPPPSQGGDGGRDLENSLDSTADPYGALPEVILSGALHGDERVGPTAVLETAAILLESAHCESLPRIVSGGVSMRNGGDAEDEDETTRRTERKHARHKSRHKKVSSLKRKGRQVRRRHNKLVTVRKRNQKAMDASRRTDRDYIEKRKRQRRQELLAQSPRSTAATYYPTEQLDEARICRSSLKSRGIPGSERRWLARLVSTRRIVIVPSANSLGYFRNVRHEGENDGLDPNRDFPYDLSDPNMCMRTIAGRTMNELFRQHIFQMGITFHGGMEAVAYEWGAPSYQLPDAPKQASALNPVPSYAAPDSVSQKQMSHIYSSYGGKFIKNGGEKYPVGTMNELVYPVGKC